MRKVYLLKIKTLKKNSYNSWLVKKYISLGFEVSLVENGSHLGIKDEHFKEMVPKF